METTQVFSSFWILNYSILILGGYTVATERVHANNTTIGTHIIFSSLRKCVWIIQSNYIIFETWSSFQLLSSLSRRHGKYIWHILGHRSLRLADPTPQPSAVYYGVGWRFCWVSKGLEIRFRRITLTRFESIWSSLKSA